MNKMLYSVELDEEDENIITTLSGDYDLMPTSVLIKTMKMIFNDLNERLQERRDLDESSHHD